MSDSLYITSGMDWTPALIEQVYGVIEKIGREELELDFYTNQIEIISAEQMIDAYASIGLPVHYHHWSFGKDFLRNAKAYAQGDQGLALEIVINSNPCISYLMEDNMMVDQAMVIAHAAIGHNSVYKNNVYFKEWTNAGSIIDYMIFARSFISQCEERYGVEEVEKVLDAAHALAPHGVDKFKRKHKPRLTEEMRLAELIKREEQEQRELDIIIKRTSFVDINLDDPEEVAAEEEENLLYFIMKKSPTLPQWKREIIRIVYKVNSYFYPQSMCKTVHEGMATFCHFYIMTRLEEMGIISPDAFIAFLKMHSGVIFQPTYDKRYYSGSNPYALGFAILKDVKRICENPTEEDKQWFPHLIGKRWQDAVKEAAFEHRDDSFVMQYLSPKVIRDLGLFSIHVNFNEDANGTVPAYVSDIHDEVGYKHVRQVLASSFERVNYVPQISVVGADMDGDRTLKLRYTPYQGRQLDVRDAEAVVDYIEDLWGYSVELDVPNQ